MNNALKFGLIAFAAWWLLRDQIGASLTQAHIQAPEQPSDPLSEPPPPPPNSPAAPANQAAPQSTPAAAADPLVLAATIPAMAHLAGNTKLTADQWNWYNAQGRGSETSVDLFTPGNRGELITAQEYWVRRLAAGLSGLRRVDRLWAN